MAQTYYGLYKRWNGVDWDTVVFKSNADVVSETIDRKWLSAADKTAISTYLSTFNASEKLLKLNASGKIEYSELPFSSDTYFKASGGNITGDVSLANDKVVNFGGAASISGDEDGLLSILASLIDLNSKPITGLAMPASEDPTAAATKGYVDQLIATGTRSVESVKVATVGQNIDISGLGIIDGYQLLQNDRILVKDQTVSANNGIYEAKSGSWTKIAAESVEGTMVFVEHGTVNNDSTWVAKTGGEWFKFSQVDLLEFGEGLTQSGNIIKLADVGILNKHIANNAAISVSKLGNLTAAENLTWTGMSAAGTAATLTNHVKNIYSAIKVLRGTDNYNTNNLETVSGAYTLANTKNRTYMGTDATPAGSNYITGDVYIQYTT